VKAAGKPSLQMTERCGGQMGAALVNLANEETKGRVRRIPRSSAAEHAPKTQDALRHGRRARRSDTDVIIPDLLRGAIRAKRMINIL